MCIAWHVFSFGRVLRNAFLGIAHFAVRTIDTWISGLIHLHVVKITHGNLCSVCQDK